MALLAKLCRDKRGAAIIEFALLAPVFIALMMGVVEVGLYMQNYNAVHSLATDATRFATVEYQKNNKLDPAGLENNIASMGTESPYNLNPDNLHVSVDPVIPSEVNGALQFALTVDYDLPDLIGGTSIDNITISYSRQIFVLD